MKITNASAEILRSGVTEWETFSHVTFNELIVIYDFSLDTIREIVEKLDDLGIVHHIDFPVAHYILQGEIVTDQIYPMFSDFRSYEDVMEELAIAKETCEARQAKFWFRVTCGNRIYKQING